MIKSPYNKDKAIGQKKAFREEELLMIRKLLHNQKELMELALFDTAIDTMLRASDLLTLKVRDVFDWEGNVKDEIYLMQQKTRKSHKVFLYDSSKKALKRLIKEEKKSENDYLFSYRKDKPMSRYQYSRLVKKWATYLHLDPSDFATHSLRRSRAAIIYRETRNLEAVRILLGQRSLSSTAKYLGVDKEEAYKIGKKYSV